VRGCVLKVRKLTKTGRLIGFFRGNKSHKPKKGEKEHISLKARAAGQTGKSSRKRSRGEWSKNKRVGILSPLKDSQGERKPSGSSTSVRCSGQRACSALGRTHESRTGGVLRSKGNQNATTRSGASQE